MKLLITKVIVTRRVTLANVISFKPWGLPEPEAGCNDMRSAL